MKIKRSDNINNAIINAISVALVFLGAVLIASLAVAAFFYEGEFVSALKGRIKPTPTFIISTVLVLFFSSVLYTPFSYGISMYFLKSKTEKTSYLQIFYLFKNMRLLLKAVLIDTIRRLITTLIRLIVLGVAVVVEILVLCLFQDVTRVIFVTVTVFMWSVVITFFFVIKLKFILCKYVFIAKPQSRVLYCISKGRRAIQGKIIETLRFYLKYLAIYIFSFFTLGFSGAKRVNHNRDSFCTYAVRLVSNY